MGLAFNIRIPECSNTERGRLLLAQYTQHELNALARINADWVLEQWKRRDEILAQASKATGPERARLLAAAERAVPPCCAKCGGVTYVARPPLDSTIPFESSPVILQTKRASCGSIAACHTGHKIAEAMMGTLKDSLGNPVAAMSWDEACSRIYVQLAQGPDPRKPTLLHAVCNDDGRIIDATEGMVRA